MRPGSVLSGDEVLPTTPNVKMFLMEDVGRSMLARTRVFVIKLFLMLISWALNDKNVRSECDRGGQSSARLSLEPYILIHVLYVHPTGRFRFYSGTIARVT